MNQFPFADLLLNELSEVVWLSKVTFQTSQGDFASSAFSVLLSAFPLVLAIVLAQLQITEIVACMHLIWLSESNSLSLSAAPVEQKQFS